MSIHSLAPQTGLAKEFFSTTQESFRTLKINDRLVQTLKKHGNVALTSSFGIQSIVMLELLYRTGLLERVPVVTVDIAGDAWQIQRDYRDALQRHYGFDLHIFKAADEGDKLRALQDGLASLKVSATLDGIRKTQTKIRQAKDFIEDKKTHTAIHPILDWPDARVDYFIEGLNGGIQHPHWRPGAQSKGGLVLLQGQEKTECGLHI